VAAAPARTRRDGLRATTPRPASSAHERSPSAKVGLALPIVACATIAVEHPWTVPLRPEPILSTMWLGMLGSAVAYLISFRLLARWDATRASLVTYLLPVVGVALGAVFLQEQIDARVLVGAALIVGGVALVNLRRPRNVARGIECPGNAGGPGGGGSGPSEVRDDASARADNPRGRSLAPAIPSRGTLLEAWLRRGSRGP